MENKIGIGINGFGRIGRAVFRLLMQHPHFEVRAINDLADAATLAHLLKYDSVHGVIKTKISNNGNNLVVDGREIPVSNEKLPEEINWTKNKVAYVIESTGKFKTTAVLEGHLQPGVEKVILSVPPQDEEIKLVVMGVNEHILDGRERIISNASCTTNNAAPMLKLIHEHWGINKAYITTVHSYTTDQSLHDQPHRDLRRARAATQSIIPTTTGAAKALTKIFPDLSDVIGGCGIRVPVPNGSLTDMTLHTQKTTHIEEVNEVFKKASVGRLKNIVQYTEDPIVGVDILGNPHSCVFDGLMTSVIGGDFVKIIGWYDNEIGYASRLIDLISLVSKK